MPKEGLEGLVKEEAADFFGPGSLYGDVERLQGPEQLLNIMILGGDLGNVVRYMELRGPYTGSNPHIMLGIANALHDTPEELTYGIAGFEMLKRDPKELLLLAHPQAMAQYAATTAASNEELSALLKTFTEAMLSAERPRSSQNLLHKFSASKEEYTGAVIAVSREVAGSIGHITSEYFFEEAGKGEEARKEMTNKLKEAYRAMALAAQNLGNDALVLEVLQLYEQTGGSYDMIKGIDDKHLDAYARRRYGMDTLSTGKTPKSLTYNDLTSPLNRIPGLFSFDDSFRLQHFQKVEGWGEVQEEAPLPEEKPISFDEADFASVGVSRDMSWQQAHGIFRERIKGMAEVFNNLIGTSTATRRAADYISLWKRIEPYFTQKSREEMEAAIKEREAATQPQPK